MGATFAKNPIRAEKRMNKDHCSSFHKQSKDLSRDYEKNRIAQAAWRELYRISGDPEQQIKEFSKAHPGIVPECFRGDDERDPLEQKNRRRKGIELIYGKPQNGVRFGGLVGRLRALVGEALEHRVVHFRDIPQLEPLRDDIFTLFATEQIEYVQMILEQVLPHPCFYSIERGYRELHTHFLCKPGASNLGAKARLVEDNDLLTTAGYLAKRPAFTPENGLGYVSVRQACSGDRVATRHLAKGLGARRTGITLSDIEAVLGACPGSALSPETPKLHVSIIQDKNPKPVRSDISASLAEPKPVRRKVAA
jgi:hypothetical protein